jgi:hypothetical protein
MKTEVTTVIILIGLFILGVLFICSQESKRCNRLTGAIFLQLRVTEPAVLQKN